MIYFDEHYVTEFYKERKTVKLEDLKPFDIILEENVCDYDITANLVYLDHELKQEGNHKVLTLTVIMPSGDISNLISFVYEGEELTFDVIGRAKAKAKTQLNELTNNN